MPVERVIERHGDGPDERALRLALLEEIRRDVPFDAFAWLLTDPESEVGCAPLADVPCLPELPRLIRLKYLTPLNRWTALDGPVATLLGATGRRPERSLVWRELLSAYDVHDVASVVFRDGFGCWGFLDLWRTASSPFTDAEAARLAAMAEPVTAALRRCQARTFDQPAPLPASGGPVVLVLSPDLDVRAQTAETDELLRALVPTDADRAPVPAGAYNVAAQLLAVESAVDAHEPSARVHLGAGTWLRLRAARVGRGRDGDIAVTVELCPPTGRRTLFARAHGLSPREAELLDHLARGADTRTVARAMYLSEHTVQDHLKSVFAKTGARNRRTLLARLAGH